MHIVGNVCMSLHVYRLVYISLLAYRAAVSVFLAWQER